MAHAPINPPPGASNFNSNSNSNAEASSSTPIRPRLISNLTTQTHLLSTLFTILSSPNPSVPLNPVSLPPNTPNTAPGIYAALGRSIEEFQEVLEEAYAHQEAYTRLMRLSAQVRGLEGDVRSRLRALEGGIGELEGLVREGRKARASIDKSETDPVSSSTLLAMAQNLANHSSAPVSTLLDPHLKSRHKPWPGADAMRMGILFMMGGSMAAVGDTGTIGDEGTNTSRMEVDSAQQQQQYQHIREEETRRYDPNAVFQLELNSDSDEDG